MNNQSHPRLPYGIYPAAEKPAGLYTAGTAYNPAAPTGYQAPQAGYLAATSPTSAQRFMTVSQGGYPAIVTSSSMYSGTPSYMPAAGYYQATPGHPAHAHSLTGSSLPTSLSYQAQSQYPTYIGTQISPSSNPYAAAAAATGHPLYPSSYTASPLAGLQQVQPSQVAQAQVPGVPTVPTVPAVPGRTPTVGTGVSPMAYANLSGAPGYQVGAHYPPY